MEAVSVLVVDVPGPFSDLMEISSHVENAIVLDGDEMVVTSLASQERAEQLASAIRGLVAAAERTGAGMKQMEVALPEGHVFVVCEGSHVIGATTPPDPPSGLVFYDLRACVASLTAEGAAKKDAGR